VLYKLAESCVHSSAPFNVIINIVDVFECLLALKCP